MKISINNHTPRHVNLLYIDKYPAESHYILIKNLSGPINHPWICWGHKVLVCPRCCNTFRSPSIFEKHKQICKQDDAIILHTPPRGSVMRFTQYEHQLEVSFAVYADCESVLSDVKSLDFPKNAYQEHSPHSIALYLSCSFNDQLSRFKLFNGENYLKSLVNIERLLNFLFSHYNTNF